MADVEGQWVILTGSLEHYKVTTVGVYAPNGLQAELWRKLGSLIQVSEEVILLGNRNAFVNTSLDTSTDTSVPSILPYSFGLHAVSLFKDYLERTASWSERLYLLLLSLGFVLLH